jgi:hypothetical protein
VERRWSVGGASAGEGELSDSRTASVRPRKAPVVAKSQPRGWESRHLRRSAPSSTLGQLPEGVGSRASPRGRRRRLITIGRSPSRLIQAAALLCRARPGPYHSFPPPLATPLAAPLAGHPHSQAEPYLSPLPAPI